MNPEQLLQHFERISEAPDAIARLRRFILDLAVRGKLVEQDPNDEPASELLRQIQSEKSRLILERSIKTQQALPPINAEVMPHTIPEGWIWVYLNDVTDLVYGKLLPTTDLLPSGYDVFGANGVIGKYSEFLYKDEMLLISCRGAYSGTPNISPPNCYVTNNSIVCQFFAPNKCNIRYFYSVLTVSNKEKIVSGTAQPQVTVANAIRLPIPLPPLAEQHRIVAKVDELMALCDQLQAAQTEREQHRDRLVAASLHCLNPAVAGTEANTPDTQRESARFLFNHLPRLTTRPEHIKQLRQTILNLAVRGKLVPQDPNDEPAAKLSKRIEKEINDHQVNRSYRKAKPLPPVKSDEKPFILPFNWEWARLRSLAFVLGDGIHGTPIYTDGTNYFFINGNNLADGKIVIKSNTKTVSFEEMQKHKKPMSTNTVLVSINGTLGNVAFYNNEEVVLGKSACYFNLSSSINKYYIKLLIESPYFLEYALLGATGTTIKNLSLKQ
ncbi:restriction endonuclease subunit S [Methylomonas koyamae]|uniref:restriction endonuclease subunit S n=1 Tax=Methylomonas koyamae TaxID=702114 RepID=UPI0006D236BB|nr:restriction endonuclease subunit S [Methylomonas koyamae]